MVNECNFTWKLPQAVENNCDSIMATASCEVRPEGQLDISSVVDEEKTNLLQHPDHTGGSIPNEALCLPNESQAVGVGALAEHVNVQKEDSTTTELQPEESLGEGKLAAVRLNSELCTKSRHVAEEAKGEQSEAIVKSSTDANVVEMNSDSSHAAACNADILDSKADTNSHENITAQASSSDSEKPAPESSPELVPAEEALLTDIEMELIELELPPTIKVLNGIKKEASLAAALRELETLRLRCSLQEETINKLAVVDQKHQKELCGLQAENKNQKEALEKHIATELLNDSSIKQLEEKLQGYQQEVTASKERLAAQEQASRSAMAQIQKDLTLRLEQANKRCDEDRKEKEAMVMKYVRGEKEALDLRKDKEGLEKKLRESIKEIEKFTARVKLLTQEKGRLGTLYEARDGDVHKLNKEIEKQKEEINSRASKIKWAQNKLKSELDSHKETKEKLRETTAKLSEAREETEQIRMNCQEMIKTYQESEEIKSNELDVRLRVTEGELRKRREEQNDYMEIHGAKIKELEHLKRNFKEGMDELRTLRTKVKCLEEERIRTEEELAKYREIINRQKAEILELQEGVRAADRLQEQIESDEQEQAVLREELAGLNCLVADLRVDIAGSREREAELLAFAERLASKNAQLQSDSNGLQASVDRLEACERKLMQELQTQGQAKEALAEELGVVKKQLEEEQRRLGAELTEATRQLALLRTQADELRDELATQKRKHAANTKDMSKQLMHARRKLEQLETTQEGRESGGMGSRSSSSGSLNVRAGGSRDEGFSEAAGSSPGTADSFPEVDKSVLIERIVRLQKTLAKKNEKVEFLEDHNQQLLEELRRKTKIIHSYIMREESGALSSEASDMSKAQLSRKGGIMASVFSSQPADSTMTLELSLQINHKLQAVLEDTVLKNITLKENMQTLGKEIERLTKLIEEHQTKNQP
ncbi:coiled-coil domain-containing protein 186 isoform X2 [Lampetra planeri]